MSLSYQIQRAIYQFWPAKQGLFTSGQVQTLGKTFSWVYDCGTSSKVAILDQPIKEMKQSLPNERLDLLAISHFHKDHKSGIDRLRKDITIENILLPYYSLWQRLVMAVLLGYEGKDLIEYIYPLQALHKKGIKAKNVIIVTKNLKSAKPT
ncbi:hypothetical protein B0187_02860 [Haemophilus paracuniculus]|uniref:Metallo-beta-lactamase domain-containing protein n=1 Tax=Haemophilus paracuniculus TaxID=734 RepID=A0A1T0ATS8_9PAST|nr:hypothetical protein [Haemophilus paracuniculus]OOR99765.1 hypothetical protein B0187_02860 [Haemophilus paracuniculus]